MRKRDELADPTSCLSKARDDEWIFVLLERDPSAAVAVRAWVDSRIALGLNDWNDPKIVEALQWADRVQCMHLRARLEAMARADRAQAAQDLAECRREHALRLAQAQREAKEGARG
jgi:hypothetical protein